MRTEQENVEAFKQWYASHRPHDCWSAWQEAAQRQVSAEGWPPERADRVSNVSRHGRATHWMPLPPDSPQGETA